MLRALTIAEYDFVAGDSNLQLYVSFGRHLEHSLLFTGFPIEVKTADGL
jgi:hypothetical protein